MFDYEYKNKDNMLKSKLIFINWNPDSSPLKGRVLYATAKENFKKYLDLNTKDYTICSKDDVQNIEQEIIKDLDKHWFVWLVIGELLSCVDMAQGLGC